MYVENTGTNVIHAMSSLRSSETLCGISTKESGDYWEVANNVALATCTECMKLERRKRIAPNADKREYKEAKKSRYYTLTSTAHERLNELAKLAGCKSRSHLLETIGRIDDLTALVQALNSSQDT